ncbi:Uma2 family endonuclease [Microcoleus sp. FACHB-1515]|uniref:Uma2 family endonuclease n=1 Tax=Cyanophyceae TaxID=3028117 RepID=UPI001688BE90|nr:Uma2 family endonuclease [Microcoleus sp. FACHB-1515]MBD2089390.1 Uma2 family endonuclease [Microcoleus sp. FACHB-1515]
MISQTQSASNTEIIYPDSDGRLMADNTEQFQWIVTIEQNLDWLFADRADVFVAGDLLWYPVEGNNKLCTAPDVLVAFGRPKGKRGSYQQWKEENIPPQVVFEILSPSNTKAEMNRKLLFYYHYGVEEYYLYDPDRNELSGWQRSADLEFLEVIESIADWVSPRLQIRFRLTDLKLLLFHPDGKPFLTYAEIAQQAEQAELHAEQERQRAEQERQRAEQERQRAEQAELRVEQAELRAEQARQQADEERQRADRLAEQLRAMGIDSDQS